MTSETPGTPASVELDEHNPPQAITTFDVGFSTDAGYRIKTAFDMPKIPVDMPADEKWWCVIDGEGPAMRSPMRIYGPYLTETAAQSLADELGRGVLTQMNLA